VDLIANWWSRGGFDATGATATRRQRAIVELGASRARKLSQPIIQSELSQATIDVVDELVNDGILQIVRFGHSVRFAHDIFFEWAFFHRLSTATPDGLERLGRPVSRQSSGALVELLSPI